MDIKTPNSQFDCQKITKKVQLNVLTISHTLSITIQNSLVSAMCHIGSNLCPLLPPAVSVTELCITDHFLIHFLFLIKFLLYTSKLYIYIYI